MNPLKVIRNEFFHLLGDDHIAVNAAGTPIARAADRASVERAAPDAVAYFSAADFPDLAPVSHASPIATRPMTLTEVYHGGNLNPAATKIAASTGTIESSTDLGNAPQSDPFDLTPAPGQSTQFGSPVTNADPANPSAPKPFKLDIDTPDLKPATPTALKPSGEQSTTANQADDGKPAKLN